MISFLGTEKTAFTSRSRRLLEQSRTQSGYRSITTIKRNTTGFTYSHGSGEKEESGRVFGGINYG
jgi:hypothetical protein